MTYVEEIHYFHGDHGERRMAEKLAWTPGGNMFMSQPDIVKGMAEVAKEMAKTDGAPVYQTVVMGAAGVAPAAGQTPDQQPQAQPQQQPAERPSVGGALGGALGGRFGLGRKKSQPQPESQPTAQQQAQTQPSTAPGTLLEMNTEFANFSTGSVDESQFAIPAGFKKVDSDLKRMQ